MYKPQISNQLSFGVDFYVEVYKYGKVLSRRHCKKAGFCRIRTNSHLNGSKKENLDSFKFRQTVCVSGWGKNMDRVFKMIESSFC